MNILINIFIGLAGAIPIALMKLLFKNKYTKILGIIVCIGCNAACLYMAIVKAAILGVDKSNEWGVAYFVGVF
jgi:hypothetical protein